MSYVPISNTVPQYSIDGDSLAAGYYLKGYTSGTTTPLSMAVSNAVGASTLAKCKLNTAGYPLSNDADDTSVFIPHFNADYKLALYTNATDADNNTTANAVWVVDAIHPNAAVDTVSVKDHGAVGDGVTDDGTAIAAAVATGKAVYFPKGEYLLSDGTAITPVQGQKLYGDGYASGIRKNSSQTAGTDDYVTVTVDDVTIQDLRFEDSTGAGQYAIVTNGCNNTKITNCSFIGNQCDNIFIEQNSTDVIISHNLFDEGKLGVATGGLTTAGATNGPVERVIITDNIFLNTGTEAVDINHDSHFVVVDNNVFKDCHNGNPLQGGETIDVGGGTDPNHCTDITITNNDIDLYVAAAPQNIRGIRLKDNAGTGVDRFVVSNNRIYRSTIAATGTGVNGIDIENSDDGVISDNYIENCTRGIVGTSDNTGDNITITGNSIKNVIDAGIVLGGTGATKVIVSDNVIAGGNSGNVGNLINVSGLSQDLTIQGNILRGPGIATAGNGIAITNASTTRVMIDGNQIRAAGKGIDLVDAIDNVQITNNNISDCWTDGIDLGSNPTHLTVNGNTIYDCDASVVNGGSGSGITVTSPTEMMLANNHVYETRSGASRTLTIGITIAAGGTNVSYTGNSVQNIADGEAIAALTTSQDADNLTPDVP